MSRCELQPGMMCRVTGSMYFPDNVGKIVTLVKNIGTPPDLGIPGSWVNKGGWWEIDTPLKIGNPIFWEWAYAANGALLQPINPDHQTNDVTFHQLIERIAHEECYQ